MSEKGESGRIGKTRKEKKKVERKNKTLVKCKRRSLE
jgi:hypothetical protein